MSLINELRAKKFSEVQGNEVIKTLLKKIALQPESMPRNIILYGGYGNGKTTLAKLFHKFINCENKAKGDICGECEHCKNPSTVSLMEIDASEITKADKMRDLVKDFQISFKDIYKVVIIDEAHLISKTAFSALLKVIEENTKNVFFVFCTTELDKLLDTIKSRSILVEVESLTLKEVNSLIDRIEKAYNLDPIPDKIRKNMYFKSNGHTRDLLQQIELYNILGEDEYLKKYKILLGLFEKVCKGDTSVIEEICKQPNYVIDYEWGFYVKHKEDMKLLIQHLKYRGYIKDTSDWYIFFKLIANANSTITASKTTRKIRT